MENTLNWQALFNIAVLLAGAGGGALAKIIWDTLTKLRDDLSTLAKTVQTYEDKSHEVYMRRDDFHSAMLRLEASMERGFDRLEKRLDGKVDK